DVVGAGLEDAADEPVAPVVHEYDDRPLWPLLERALDEEERPVGVPAARGHDEVRRGLLERVPALVETVDDADDLDPSRPRQRSLDDLPICCGVDGDEGSDRGGHSYLTGLTPSSRRPAVTRPGFTGRAP